MAAPKVTKRKGRKHYSVWLDGKYHSTGQTDQRTAIEVARRMQAVGVEAYRQGKQTLSEELRDLIEEHLKHLRDNDGRGHEHIRKKRIHLMRPINERAFKYLRDVQKRSFQAWWETLECGAKTRNEYMTSWNVFLDWLVYEDRLDENPIRGKIRRARASKDETRTRRALTLDELSSLVSVSERRALLYLTAATTGARFNELMQLRWSEVHEEAVEPHIVLRADTTKNGKQRTQYITPELARELTKARCRAKTDRVFRKRPSHHTITKDIAAAGIAKKTDDGIASFHSLRHTFTTIIAKQTKDPRIAQRMADHADITTTQGYLHTERAEHAAVMKNFPSLLGERRATGRASKLVQTGQIVSNWGAFGLSESCMQVSAVETLSPIESESVVRSPLVEPGGIEPPCRNSPRAASTRVVADFISLAEPSRTPCSARQPQKVLTDRR